MELKVLRNNKLLQLEDVLKNMLSLQELPPINSNKWLSLEPLKNEVWAEIPGFEEFYMVSCYGRVLSLGRYVRTCAGGYYKEESILKLKKSPKSLYYTVSLNIDGKVSYKTVHRLVAISFMGDHAPKIVNHKDENKFNPILSNLEWCTQRENCNYGNAINKMRTSFEASGICKPVALVSESGSIVKVYKAIIDAARDLGMNSTGIKRACDRKRKYDGLIFRYLTIE